MKCPKGRFIEQKGRSAVGQRWEQKLTANGPEETLWGDGNILKPYCGDGRTKII